MPTLTRADRGLIARTKQEWHSGQLTDSEAEYWFTHYLGEEKALQIMRGLLTRRELAAAADWR